MTEDNRIPDFWWCPTTRAVAQQLDVAPSTVSRLESGFYPSVEVTLRVLEWLEEDCPTCKADAHVTADPAQTTELEAIEDAVAEFQVRDADGPVPNVSLAERVRVLFDEWREVTAERDEARAQRNDAMETAGQLRDEVHEHQVAAANLYGRVFVALGLSITAPWAGLPDAAGRVRAERDERQARIDAAFTTCEAASVLISLAGNPSEWAAAEALIADVRAALKGELPACAALVGDQPLAEEPKRRCCIGPFADGTHAPGCLDACQDCGGDETGPHRCQCSDVDPVCTCTPSRCDYDGYPLDGPACLPCGQRPVGKPCLANDEPLSGEALRAVEEADDAAGDHP